MTISEPLLYVLAGLYLGIAYLLFAAGLAAGYNWGRLIYMSVFWPIAACLPWRTPMEEHNPGPEEDLDNWRTKL